MSCENAAEEERSSLRIFSRGRLRRWTKRTGYEAINFFLRPLAHPNHPQMSSLSSRTSSSTFTSPSSSRPTTPGPDSLFDIASTRSGYLGAFASCDISKGTLVLSERPLFTVDAPLEAFLFNRSQGGNGPTPPDGEEEEAQAETFEEFLDQGIRRKVAAKNEDQRRAFWDLANTHDELPPALGIFTTNAVS